MSRRARMTVWNVQYDVTKVRTARIRAHTQKEANEKASARGLGTGGGYYVTPADGKWPDETAHVAISTKRRAS